MSLYVRICHFAQLPLCVVAVPMIGAGRQNPGRRRVCRGRATAAVSTSSTRDHGGVVVVGAIRSANRAGCRHGRVARIPFRLGLCRTGEGSRRGMIRGAERRRGSAPCELVLGQRGRAGFPPRPLAKESLGSQRVLPRLFSFSLSLLRTALGCAGRLTSAHAQRGVAVVGPASGSRGRRPQRGRLLPILDGAPPRAAWP